MSKENDAKIKTLLQAIETKKNSIGEKPKAHWETNGVIPVENGININTVNSIDRCVELCAQLMMQRGYYEQACGFLGVDSDVEVVKTLTKYINDISLKVKIIRWDTEKKKLQQLEKQLKDLRSEEAKTEDALADIISDLKL